MAQSSLLTIISQKMVKPSSPTPPSSRYYKLSAFDASMVDSTATIAMFFPEGSFHGGNSSKAEELFEVLETSLSKTLTYYYPFAGRFMDDNITIDCNDAGVQLWQVQVHGSMSDILNNRTNYHPWNSMFHQEMYRCDISHVMVQLSYFECGGVSIICSFSHKLGDGSTLGNFLNDWAVIARGSQDVPAPILSAASIFPPPDNSIIGSLNENNSDVVTQRFVFSALNISKLKKMAIAETEIKNPTQNEVVTALIFKSIISATKKLNSSSSFKPSSLVQILNFRSITIPPLSEKMVGNFVDKFVITTKEENEMTFSKIVTKLRKCKVEYVDAHKACLEGNEFVNQFARLWIEDNKKLKDINNSDLYVFSSVFRVPYYEANFGFGKPIFVCIPGGMVDKVIILMGNPNGDGIDAFVTLKQDQMSIFEHDKELLAFASLNPVICTAN